MVRWFVRSLLQTTSIFLRNFFVLFIILFAPVYLSSCFNSSKKALPTLNLITSQQGQKKYYRIHPISFISNSFSVIVTFFSLHESPLLHALNSNVIYQIHTSFAFYCCLSEMKQILIEKLENKSMCFLCLPKQRFLNVRVAFVEANRSQ